MPKRMPIHLVVVLLFLSTVAPAAAILQCGSCHCGTPCTTVCNNFSTTCGSYGVCAGSASCGGGVGCLTSSDLDAFLATLAQDPAPPTAVQQRQAQVAARLTWRLAEQAELEGLGTVYVGGSGFRLQGPRGRVLTADIALVSAGAAAGAVAGVPALVVELAGTPGFRSNAASWLRAGTSAVLVVDPASGTVSVRRSLGEEAQVLAADDLLELPDLLPNWSLHVAELFQ